MQNLVFEALGPQNEPEAGDWYARGMYYPGGQQTTIGLTTEIQKFLVLKM